MYKATPIKIPVKYNTNGMCANTFKKNVLHVKNETKINHIYQ
uniref:Uncharacterized protein n=1 Tax=Anguilla anguilla TaxID=7936 RepID=A0A0E9XRY5_ANGAN